MIIIKNIEKKMVVIEKIEEIIKKIENSKTPFVYFLLTFFFVISLRNFVELYLAPSIIPFINFFSHFYLFYFCLILSIIILFHFVTKEKIEKISRLVLCSSLILIIPVIIDSIISLKKRYIISYLLPFLHKDLLLRFLTFFGKFNEIGITPGIRVEVALVILGSFIYFYVKKRSVIRSLFFAFLTYSLIFFYLSMPFATKIFLNIFNLDFYTSNLLMQNYFALLLFLLINGVFFLYNKEYFREIIKGIRPLRLFHFELMLILGAVSARIFLPYTISRQVPESAIFYSNWIFMTISVLFAWLFSVVTNNLVDYKIDKMAKNERPSMPETIPTAHYKKLALIFFVLAVAYAAIVNLTTLFLILLFMGNYFLYSIPPLRLKRVPFFSKLLISLNSLVLVMLGNFFITESIVVPSNVAFFFLIFFTASINFIDIKDYESDRKAGIKTLPVILGLRKSKIIIGLFFIISYLSAYFPLRGLNLLPFLFLLGVLQFFFVNKKNFNEKPVFIVYLFSVIALIAYLIINAF